MTDRDNFNRRTINNRTTLNDLLINRLDIQSTDIALTAYKSDPNNPELKFDLREADASLDIIGDLSVTGSAVFGSVTIDEFDAGMVSLASNNTADLLDIGFFGKYNDGTEKYTGLVRDASEPLQRYIFFKDVVIPPGSTVTIPDSTFYNSVAMDYCYFNDGTTSLPSITFNADTDTGITRIGTDNIGIITGATKILDLNKVSGSDTQITLDNTTTLNMKKYNTIDNVVSDNPAISSGNIYIESESAIDKWLRMYSTTDAVEPSFSGTVYTSPNEHYFVSNTDGNLEFNYSSDVPDSSTPPDFRDASKTSMFKLVSNTHTQFDKRITLPNANSATNPDIAWNIASNTGIYRISASAGLGFTVLGNQKLAINQNDVTSVQPFLIPDGVLATPSLGFSTNSDVGFYRDSGLGFENISFSIDGVDSGKLLSNGGVPQLAMSDGTSALPSYTWASELDTGFYRPSDNQLGLSTGGISRVIWDVNKMDLLNDLEITPNGSSLRKVKIDDDASSFNNYIKGVNVSLQSYNLINDDLVALYTFEDSETATTLSEDFSGNDLNGTPTGPSVNSLGCSQDANSVLKSKLLDLTANTSTTNYISLTSHLTSFQDLDLVSITGWFRITGSLTNDNTIIHFGNASNDKSISVSVLSDGNGNHLQVLVESDSLTTLGFRSVATVNDDLWHSFTVLLGANGNKLYLDNTELTVAGVTKVYTGAGDNAGGTNQSSSNTLEDLTISKITIGARNQATVDNKYTGLLKNIYISNSNLSISQINTLYDTDTKLNVYELDATTITTCNIALDNQIKVGDGSASNPSYTFINESDKGMYSAGSDELGFSIAGKNAYTIKDDSGDIRNIYNGDIFMNAGVLSVGFDIENNLTTSNHMDVHLYNNGAPARTPLGSYLSIALPEGYPGIIINKGAGTIGSSTKRYDIYVNDPSNNLVINNNTDGIDYFDMGTTEITAGLRILYPDSVLASPAISFTNDSNTGFYNSGDTDQIGVSCGGVDSGVITDTHWQMRAPMRMPIGVLIGDSGGSAIEQTIADGLIGPHYSFDQPNNIHGMYLVTGSPNELNFAVDGIKIGGYEPTGLVIDIDGSAATPSLEFTGSSDTDTGLYHPAADQIGVSTGGDVRMLFTNTHTQTLTPFRTADGLISAPSYGFTSNVNTGMYYTTDQLNFAINGVSKLDIASTGISTSAVSISDAGSAASPSLLFTSASDADTGFYHPAADQIGISTGGNERMLITDTSSIFGNNVWLADGSVTFPSLTFTNDTSKDMGFYRISENRLGVANNGQNTFVWDVRGVLPHQSLNEMDFLADGTNVRVQIEDTKLKASSNQDILEDAVYLYYKFDTDPNTDPDVIDSSVNKITNNIVGTVGYTTSSLTLTDVNGLGLVDFQAITLGSGNNSITTDASELTDILLLDEYKFRIRIKADSIASTGQLFSIYGNSGATSADYIKLSIDSSGDIHLDAKKTADFIVANTTSTPISVDIWYLIELDFTSSGHTMTINGSLVSFDTYTTGSSSDTLAPKDLDDTSALISVLGGDSTTNSMDGIIAEYSIITNTTTQTATALYPIQTHELYTNKLQISDPTGLIDEGYFLRSDSGNNAIWDNSLQIMPSSVNSSKVLRAPDGTSNFPSYSFNNDTSSGLYSSSSGNIGVKGNLLLEDGTTSSPSLSFVNDNTAGLSRKEIETAIYASSNDTNRWIRIAYNTSTNRLASVSNDGTNRIMYSDNGTSWTGVTAPNDGNDFTGVVYDEDFNRFVAVSINGTNRIIYSTDAISWTTVSSQDSMAFYGIGWSPTANAGSGRLVAGGGSPTLIYSDDGGATWTNASSPPLGLWADFAWSPTVGGGRFVAVSVLGNGSNAAAYSSDGITWTSVSTPDDTQDWASVIWADSLNLFVAVAPDGSNKVMYSSDGISWTATTSADELSSWRSVAWSSTLGVLMAVSNFSGDRIMYSFDAITWYSANIPLQRWRDIIWVEDLNAFISVGDGEGSNSVIWVTDLPRLETVFSSNAIGLYADSLSIESNCKIDTTSTEALLIRKNNNSGDVFTVDTTNESTNFNSGIRKKLEVDSTDTITLGADNYMMECSYSSGGGVTVTLPEASSTTQGREYIIIRTGTDTVTINTFDGNDFIDDNSTTFILLSTQFDKVILVCNGTNRWYSL